LSVVLTSFSGILQLVLVVLVTIHAQACVGSFSGLLPDALYPGCQSLDIAREETAHSDDLQLKLLTSGGRQK
jgi:hypothetical protein